MEARLEQIAQEAADLICERFRMSKVAALHGSLESIILAAMNRQGVSIALTRGKFAVVSPEDADLSLFDWHCTSHGRAAKGKSEYMHKIIGERMGLSGEIDHEDGNPLNNRRSNIRICTRTQNQANAPKHPTRGNTSKYKGVCQRGDKWIAQIKQDGKVKHLGTFDNEDDAALAYDASAVMVFGEFARLNFPAAQPQRSEYHFRDTSKMVIGNIENPNGDFRTYVCRYFHNNSWWSLDLIASDDSDAESRVSKLGRLQLLGQKMAEIPVFPAAGFLIKATCWIINKFYVRRN